MIVTTEEAKGGCKQPSDGMVYVLRVANMFIYLCLFTLIAIYPSIYWQMIRQISNTKIDSLYEVYEFKSYFANDYHNSTDTVPPICIMSATKYV